MGDAPIKLTKSQHIAHVWRVASPDPPQQPPTTSPTEPTHSPPTVIVPPIVPNFSSKIHVDFDDILSSDERKAFIDINRQFDNVFTSKFGVYNNKSGYFRARLNMGPVKPPPTKGKLPLYDRNDF